MLVYAIIENFMKLDGISFAIANIHHLLSLAKTPIFQGSHTKLHAKELRKSYVALISVLCYTIDSSRVPILAQFHLIHA